MSAMLRLRGLLDNGDLRRSLINIAWLSSEKVIRLFTGLFIGLWIARHLGPEGYGRLQYAMAWVGLFNAIAWLGVGETIIRDLVRDRDHEGRVMGSAFAIRLGGSCIAGVLAVVGGHCFGQLDDVTSRLVWIMALAIPFAEIPAGIWMWFQSHMRIRHAVLGKNAAMIGGALLRVYLLITDATIDTFAWAMVVESILLCGLLFLVYRLDGGNPMAWTYSWRSILQMLRDGLPLILSALVASLNARVDQLMLGWLADYREVGYYAAATRFSEVWWIVPPMLMNSLSPRFIYPKDLGEKLARNVTWITALLLVLALLPCLGVAIIGRPMLTALLGHGFEASIPVLTIHIWIAVFIFIDAPACQYLLTTDRQRFLIWKSLGAVVLNSLLNLLLIPRLGATGASIATLIAYAWAGCLFYAVTPGVRDVAHLQWGALRLLARRKAKEE